MYWALVGNICCLLSVICCLLSVVCYLRYEVWGQRYEVWTWQKAINFKILLNCPLSLILGLGSWFCYQLSVISCLLSVICCLLSVISCHPIAIGLSEVWGMRSELWNMKSEVWIRKKAVNFKLALNFLLSLILGLCSWLLWFCYLLSPDSYRVICCLK